MLQHFFDLAVFTLAQSHGDPHIATDTAFKRGLNRAVFYPLDRNALFQPFELADQALIVALAFLAIKSADTVAPQPAGLRQFEIAFQPAIIGKQQKPLCIDIETPDTVHPWKTGGQFLKHCGATIGITLGGHQAGRLIIPPQARRVGLANRFTVNADMVFISDVKGRCAQLAAIDRHPPIDNHFFRITARCHADARQHFGDTLSRELGFLRRRAGIFIRWYFCHAPL